MSKKKVIVPTVYDEAVAKLLKELGIELPPFIYRKRDRNEDFVKDASRGKCPFDFEEATRLREAGLSYEKIAIQLGVHDTTVWRWMRKPRVPRGEAERREVG